MTNKEIAECLNQLLVTCKDGEKGFREAASKVPSAGVQTLLTQYAQDKANTASELEAAIRQVGEKPEEEGSFLASMHRTWMDIRDAFTNQPEEVIVSECIRGEKSAKDSYQKALNEPLPAQTETLLQKHLMDIETKITELDKAQKELAAAHT